MAFTWLSTQPKKKVSQTFVIGGEKVNIEGEMLYKPLSELFNPELLGGDDGLKNLKTYEWNAKFLKASFESLTCNGDDVLASEDGLIAFCNELNCVVTYLYEKIKDFSINGKAGN